jgi:putrescine---pyruvate transaminase
MAQTAFLHPFAKPTGTDFITIVKGEGSVVWDNTGKSYIDAMASLWYNAVGHGRHEITEAVTAQMNKIAVFNCFDPFTNEPTEALAERIRDLAPVDDARVFFAGSGSEAIDSAMKLARIAHVQAGQPERDIIISRGRGYHGVNYGGTSAQGLPLNQQGFGPLLPGIINVPGDDVEAMASAFLANPGRVAAVISEPVQGAGGVWPPHEGYLQALRKLCDQHGAFLIADEVICGFGRLGEWFGCTYYGVRPDLITFAKQVTSGYIPLGGVIVGAKVRAGLEADPNFMLRHGFTYSGHPTATAAGMANLDIIEREGLLERGAKMGARLGEGLQSLVSDGMLQGLRGVGAMWATVLHEGIDSVAVRNKMYALGVIPRALPGILTFCPPYVTTDAQVDQIVDSLASALTAQHG